MKPFKDMGFVVRVDLCSDITQYESVTGVNLNKPGTNCKNSFTWSFKDSTPSLHGKFAWVAESPDGSYVIAVGVKEINKFKHQRKGETIRLFFKDKCLPELSSLPYNQDTLLN